VHEADSHDRHRHLMARIRRRVAPVSLRPPVREQDSQVLPPHSVRASEVRDGILHSPEREERPEVSAIDESVPVEISEHSRNRAGARRTRLIGANVGGAFSDTHDRPVVDHPSARNGSIDIVGNLATEASGH